MYVDGVSLAPLQAWAPVFVQRCRCVPCCRILGAPGFEQISSTGSRAWFFVSALVRVGGDLSHCREGRKLHHDVDLTTKNPTFWPASTPNPQRVANSWRTGTPLARPWERWENPLKPAHEVEWPLIGSRVRSRPAWSKVPPYARSWVEAGASWRIRGHTEEEYNFAQCYQRLVWHARERVLLEARKQRDEQLSIAGIHWKRGGPPEVPPLRWAAARSVGTQINKAFREDALRGLPKRVVPSLIKRHLTLAFEGTLANI